MEMGGSWSVYWYNGNIVSSEIARGLDVAQLTPSQFLTQNEIDAANTVRWNELNAQGQPRISWPPSFALAKAYLDQAERKQCLSASRVSALRTSIASAERATGPARAAALNSVAGSLASEAANACDNNKNQKLRDALTALANAPIS
jgi:hypothetical protein